MRRDEFPLVDKHVKNEVNAVLDKIRAEIERINPYDYPRDERTAQRMLDKVLEIIDKYKGEQDENEHK